MNSFLFPRKRDKILNSKREFADVTKLQQNIETTVAIDTMENSFNIKIEDTKTIPSEDRISPIESKSHSINNGNTINSATASSFSSISCITTVPQTTSSIEYTFEENIGEPPKESKEPNQIVKPEELVSLDDEISVESNIATNAISPIERITTSVTENPFNDNMSTLVSPTTPSVPKERKRRIIIDDDD